jgi:hypothetical protein
LISEYTGAHQPLDIEWSVAADSAQPLLHLEVKEPLIAVSPIPDVTAASPFSNFWEFAVAMNRSESAALALARDGAPDSLPVESADVRKLLGTVWFRSVVPRLSAGWKTRVLDALADGVTVPNHQVKRGRQIVPLSEMSYEDLQELAKTSTLATIRPELDLLLAVGRLFGDEALRRIRFTEQTSNATSMGLASLFHGFRHGDSTSQVEGAR